MTMNDINDILNERCCDNCSNNRDDKTTGICMTCQRNPRYSDHFSENNTIKRLKACVKEVRG